MSYFAITTEPENGMVRILHHIGSRDGRANYEEIDVIKEWISRCWSPTNEYGKKQMFAKLKGNEPTPLPGGYVHLYFVPLSRVKALWPL